MSTQNQNEQWNPQNEQQNQQRNPQNRPQNQRHPEEGQGQGRAVICSVERCTGGRRGQ